MLAACFTGSSLPLWPGCVVPAPSLRPTPSRAHEIPSTLISSSRHCSLPCTLRNIPSAHEHAVISSILKSPSLDLTFPSSYHSISLLPFIQKLRRPLSWSQTTLKPRPFSCNCSNHYRFFFFFGNVFIANSGLFWPLTFLTIPPDCSSINAK